MKKLNLSFQNDEIAKKGSLLISDPFMDDHYFGRSVVLLCEHNQEGKLHGKGIRIDKCGDIFIGYFNDGDDAPGSLMEIREDGSFFLGDWEIDEEGQNLVGTLYKTDGTIEQF